MLKSLASLAQENTLEEFLLIKFAMARASEFGIMGSGSHALVPLENAENLTKEYLQSGGQRCAVPNDDTKIDHSQPWPFGRSPISTPELEEKRVSAYWGWLDGAPRSCPGGKQRYVSTEGFFWISLDDEAGADYEAFHMRHSIGHSWRKYRQIGPLFSLRDHENLPQATVLLAHPREAIFNARDAAIIHAREHHNARLSRANMDRMVAFADVLGVGIEPDFDPSLGVATCFEYWPDNDAPNTQVRYFTRDRHNRKQFFEQIMPGRASLDAVRALQIKLWDEAFEPDLFSLETDPLSDRYELLSLSGSFAAPTRDISIQQALSNYLSGEIESNFGEKAPSK